MDLMKYYSNKKVQEILLKTSKDREVSARFQDAFGKRPDILQFGNDILEFVKKGATSFHFSEEHWSNPLTLSPGMTKSRLDNLRIGRDLILDIDGPLEFSKITAHLIVEALQFHDVENLTVKFSGNKGFHIAVPFNAFPDKVDNKKTKDLFPDGPRTIASYLKEMIKDMLAAELIKKYSVEEILKKTKKQKEDILYNICPKCNLIIEEKTKMEYKCNKCGTKEESDVEEYDECPYCKGPRTKDKKRIIKCLNCGLDDNKEDAKPENVSFNEKFLSECSDGEASKLIIQAFDWNKKLPQRDIKIQKQYPDITQKISMELFPHSIKKGLMGIEDGRKRFLFVLLNFLRSLNYDYDEIEKIIEEWNKKNREPLKEGYIRSQIMWHKRQNKVLPPNYSNKAYYDDIGLKPQENELKFKNPVNYSLSLFRSKLH